MNECYATGEVAQVGDIVKVSRNHKFNYDSYMRGASGREELFRVTEVRNGQKSALIKIDKHRVTSNYYDLVNAMSVSNFDLVESVNGATSKSKVKEYIVMDISTMKHVAYGTKEDVTKALQSLLVKNPTKHYHMFRYESTASVPRPEVIFKDDLTGS